MNMVNHFASHDIMFMRPGGCVVWSGHQSQATGQPVLYWTVWPNSKLSLSMLSQILVPLFLLTRFSSWTNNEREAEGETMPAEGTWWLRFCRGPQVLKSRAGAIVSDAFPEIPKPWKEGRNHRWMPCTVEATLSSWYRPLTFWSYQICGLNHWLRWDSGPSLTLAILLSLLSWTRLCLGVYGLRDIW